VRISYLLIPFCLWAPAGAARDLAREPWTARWIWVAESDPFAYGVYHFRRSFELKARPASFRIHVTADNRYQLFVNGERVAWGPARGDLLHWRYETLDIARHLRPGKNALAAVVWNEGEHRAIAQHSYRTGFLLQGDTEAEQVLDTGPGWVGVASRAYRPIPVTAKEVLGYVAIGPCEQFDARSHLWGWEQPDYDDSAWKPVAIGRHGSPRDSIDSPTPWFLVPRPIPFMEERPERFERVRRAEGIEPPAGFPGAPVPFEVPARTTARLLLDHGRLTTAYPELVTSGGREARIGIRYAEALWLKGKREKGHRDRIEGTEFHGYRDAIIADGGPRRLWRPLFWRTWRYVELTVETADEPLRIKDFRATATGYPFERKARFEAPGEELDRILDVGWRTARLCAHETYMDCPYYEQLQYAGDTRIQALVSIYMSGDARLARNAIEQLDASRTAEGATLSRAPSWLPQYIPPFSLIWIAMVHDYWRYAGDEEFVRRRLPGIRAVLDFFDAYGRPGAGLAHLPWWNFLDWVEDWPRGIAPAEADGSSAPLDLQLAIVLEQAAELEQALGLAELGARRREQAARLRESVRLKYWDARRGLFADTGRRDAFSQHTNALAVLAGVVRGGQARRLIEAALEQPDLARATIYFRYYLHRAMAEAGLGDQYLEMLGPWRQMLAQGLTTWAERDSPATRSDCHAWGASPNIELFRIVLGIDSAAPGFRRVLIRPHLGSLRRASGAIPHPQGEVSVALEQEDDRLRAEIGLPSGVTGEIVWRDRRRPLASGKTSLRF
jgi:hypothetical protein